MENSKIRENVRSLLDSIELRLKEDCTNKISGIEEFVCVRINDSYNPSLDRELFLSVPSGVKIMSFEPLCDYIDSIQDSITWVDIYPYKASDSNILFLVKLVELGDVEQELGFHGSFPSFRHYPIYGQKYDLNYFWEISDEDYKKREEEWCKRSQNILRKYERQKWFAERIYKYFGKKVKILDLDKEMKAINVFS